ncbi:GAF and ANTAR domain-containing protein [Terrabacter sp. NPDC000476]|uniref:GAF and ANTAR domain-containing protein n=1 Tax=Terrabacter sp. NPDC000476 TaxID=3154258 RepID=UPI003317C653
MSPDVDVIYPVAPLSVRAPSPALREPIGLDGSRSFAETPASRPQSAVDDVASVVGGVLAATTRAVRDASHLCVHVVQRGGGVRLLSATSEVPPAFDEQFTTGRGPAAAVLRGDRRRAVLRLGCADDEARWPGVAACAEALGVRTLVAVRLAWRGRVVGVLTLASSASDDVPEAVVELVAAMADHLAVTVATAQRAEQLEQALVTRQEIGQAVGILMERHALTADAAFAYLRRLSQDGNVKLHAVAQAVRSGDHGIGVPEE